MEATIPSISNEARRREHRSMEDSPQDMECKGNGPNGLRLKNAFLNSNWAGVSWQDPAPAPVPVMDLLLSNMSHYYYPRGIAQVR
jgi:hypothetical protein